MYVLQSLMILIYQNYDIHINKYPKYIKKPIFLKIFKDSFKYYLKLILIFLGII